MKAKIHVHKMIADVAVGLTLDLYETLMSDNMIRKRWKEQHPNMGENALAQAFVDKFAGRAIPAARATLATMLSGPYDERLKEQIHTAMILDADLVRGRGRKAFERRKEQNNGRP